MIKNVIFDIGNVLVNFNWAEYMQKLFPGQDDLIAKLNVAVWGDGRWERLDAGDDPEKVWSSIIKICPENEPEIKKIISRVGETLTKRAGTHEWIKDLKSRGYKVYYLSNYSRFVMDANPEVLDFLPLMDGGVFSCDVKLLKPEIEIYDSLAKKYNLVPSECVFIDDLFANVQGAILYGFKGIQCVNQEQAKQDLNKLLSSEAQ